jgi:hypothetical protein
MWHDANPHDAFTPPRGLAIGPSLQGASRWPRRPLSDLRGRQNPHRAADTPEHTEHEDDYAGNQPQRCEGWYGNPVGLIHGKPPFRTAESSGGPEGTVCLTWEPVN